MLFRTPSSSQVEDSLQEFFAMLEYRDPDLLGLIRRPSVTRDDPDQSRALKEERLKLLDEINSLQDLDDVNAQGKKAEVAVKQIDIQVQLLESDISRCENELMKLISEQQLAADLNQWDDDGDSTKKRKDSSTGSNQSGLKNVKNGVKNLGKKFQNFWGGKKDESGSESLDSKNVYNKPITAVSSNGAVSSVSSVNSQGHISGQGNQGKTGQSPEDGKNEASYLQHVLAGMEGGFKDKKDERLNMEKMRIAFVKSWNNSLDNLRFSEEVESLRKTKENLENQTRKDFAERQEIRGEIEDLMGKLQELHKALDF